VGAFDCCEWAALGFGLAVRGFRVRVGLLWLVVSFFGCRPSLRIFGFEWLSGILVYRLYFGWVFRFFLGCVFHLFFVVFHYLYL